MYKTTKEREQRKRKEKIEKGKEHKNTYMYLRRHIHTEYGASDQRVL